MTDSSSPPEAIAERLKLEGNELFKRNAFSEAYQKYTEALQHHENAILYYNRAACSIGLQRYMHATSDATKATYLDPGYAKAWGRLAKAQMFLNSPSRAVDALTRAIATLPTENPTTAERQLRAQFQGELEAARARIAYLRDNAMELTPVSEEYVKRLPWNAASRLIPGLLATNTTHSSAWVIDCAAKMWDRAIESLNRAVTTQDESYMGELGVIEGISNAVLVEIRVFRLSDPEFINKYNKQTIYEFFCHNSRWSKFAATELMVEASKLLEEEGWGPVRSGLSLTIRAWFMRAFFEEVLNKREDVAIEYYTSALEVLRWGMQRWADVPVKVKGVIFQPTFIRGIKIFRLNAWYKAYTANPGPDSRYSLEELLAGADEIIAEIDAAGEQHEDPPSMLAFHHYPAGKAHDFRATYYEIIGNRLHFKANERTHWQEVRDLYVRAAAELRTACRHIPDDDELHVWFLHRAFSLQYRAGAPLKDLLALLDEIHRKEPGTKAVWGAQPTEDMKGRSEDVGRDLKLREQLNADIASGKIPREDLEKMMYMPGFGPATDAGTDGPANVSAPSDSASESEPANA